MKLPVAQIKESHGLEINGDSVTTNGATVVVVPYQAMAVGDKVSLTWQGYSDGWDEDPWTLTVEVKEDYVGKPLLFNLPRGQVAQIYEGYAELFYSIEHNESRDVSLSDVQRFDIVAQGTDRLPAIQIKGYAGGTIDPKQYPDGLRLQVIPLYPTIQPGDDVLFYFDSSDVSLSQVYWQRVDPSTLGSDMLECIVPVQILSDNVGRTITIGYQYARLESALSSELISVLIEASQILPPPIIKDAVAGGVNKGTLEALIAASGVTIHVPNEVVLKPGETLELHWQGHPNGGNTIVGPINGVGKKFYIAPEFVAANMGNADKRFPVFYRIKDGEITKNESIEFELRIIPLAVLYYPSVQCKELGGRKTLSLARLGEDGAKAYSDLWMFVAVGQLLTIKASGVSEGGAVEVILRNATSVSALEIESEEVSAQVTMDFLRTLDLGENMALKFFVSFDNSEPDPLYPFVQLLDIKVVA